MYRWGELEYTQAANSPLVNQRIGLCSSAGLSDSGMGLELLFPALCVNILTWAVLRWLFRTSRMVYCKKDYQHVSATELGIPAIRSQKSAVSPSKSATSHVIEEFFNVPNI